MKMHTTNYFNTFIEIAEDCPATEGEMPPLKGEKKSVANMQFDMLWEQPYKYTSDEVLFGVYAARKDVPKHEMDELREAWFSKGQPCFRASPLTKRYGWGIHSDADGKIAMYGVETEAYQQMLADEGLKKTKGMRSSRAKK